MRAAIRELPDGTYRSELQTDGLMDKPITLRMALTIKGDEILMDFAGTDSRSTAPSTARSATPTPWRCTG